MQSRQGIILGFSAYVIWGLFPLYFKLLEDSGTVEIVLHRYLWALPMCALVLAVTGGLAQVRPVLRTPRRVGLLGAAALSLALTSGVYIYAVNSGHVVEASLGYFINPLVTVALGVAVLRERPRRAQWWAVGICALAVAVLTVAYGRLPWIALTLAGSFGVYGLLKNRVGGDVGALVGLTVETLVLAPVAVVGVAAYAATGHGTFTVDAPWQGLLLASGGLAIVAPLLPFAAAVRRVPLITIGLLQYITPVLQLLIGVALFHESMPASRWTGFGLVWAALAVLTADGLRARARSRAARQDRHTASEEERKRAQQGA
ncbi:EamA family transporter RarD [Streptomyces sp. NPDC048636]|uniref:EamA family transporter RarD n=1 Tax=Streptomyces sp. NPDC048636 TaxID=3155762 RepID=UPI00341ADF29